MINAKAPAEMWFTFVFFAILMALGIFMVIPHKSPDRPARSYDENGVAVQGDALEPRALPKQTSLEPEAPATAPKRTATSPRPNAAVAQ